MMFGFRLDANNFRNITLEYYVLHVALAVFLILTILAVYRFFRKGRLKLDKKRAIIILLIILVHFAFVLKFCVFAPIFEEGYDVTIISSLQKVNIFNADSNSLQIHNQYGYGQQVIHGMFQPIIKYNYTAIFYINLILLYITSILLANFVKKITKKDFSYFLMIIFLFNPFILRFATTETMYFVMIFFNLVMLMSIFYFFESKESLFIYLAAFSAVFVYNTGPISFISVISAMIFALIYFRKKISGHIQNFHVYIAALLYIIFTFTQIIILALTYRQRSDSGLYNVSSFSTVFNRFFARDYSGGNLFINQDYSPFFFIILILAGIVIVSLYKLYSTGKFITGNKLSRRLGKLDENINNYLILIIISALNIVMQSYFMFIHNATGIINDFQVQFNVIIWYLILVYVGYDMILSLAEIISPKKAGKITSFSLQAIFVIIFALLLISYIPFISMPTLFQSQDIFVRQTLKETDYPVATLVPNYYYITSPVQLYDGRYRLSNSIQEINSLNNTLIYVGATCDIFKLRPLNDNTKENVRNLDQFLEFCSMKEREKNGFALYREYTINYSHTIDRYYNFFVSQGYYPAKNFSGIKLTFYLKN